jgi:toxin FitB
VRYLLDTNVLSDIRKPKPASALLTWFDEQSPDDLYLSALTLGELREGVERLRAKDPARAQALHLWLADLSDIYGDRVVPVDQHVADEWGRLRALAGRTVPVIDALLAATARVHGLVLVSRNEKDFADLGVTVFSPY